MLGQFLLQKMCCCCFALGFMGFGRKKIEAQLCHFICEWCKGKKIKSEGTRRFVVEHLPGCILVPSCWWEGQGLLVDGSREGGEDPHGEQLDAVPVPAKGDVLQLQVQHLVSKKPSPREGETYRVRLRTWCRRSFYQERWEPGWPRRPNPSTLPVAHPQRRWKGWSPVREHSDITSCVLLLSK